MAELAGSATNTVVINSTLEVIFDLAAAIENWPKILPHYRRVDILSGSDTERRADMYAWRGFIPIKWQAVESIDRPALAIRFHHTKGATAGMDVAWAFEPVSDGTRVSIHHVIPGLGPPFIRPFSRWVIGTFFIDYVATRTLGQIKVLAEQSVQ